MPRRNSVKTPRGGGTVTDGKFISEIEFPYLTNIIKIGILEKDTIYCVTIKGEVLV